jgi:ribosomal protein L29
MGATMTMDRKSTGSETFCMPTEKNTAIQWRQLSVEELRTRVPALKTALADLERAKTISQETLKAEISV